MKERMTEFLYSVVWTLTGCFFIYCSLGAPLLHKAAGRYAQCYDNSAKNNIPKKKHYFCTVKFDNKINDFRTLHRQHK